ncbi:MAG: hypothetical protein HC852_08270 [Acaryochloridaceae cyanobacterium RU_4_10]|nr:hypothetical protein [Acaryochloridaceae cyanobacterium RU_4_10]
MARDLFHSIVKDALIKEGWQITLIVYEVEDRSILQWIK